MATSHPQFLALILLPLIFWWAMRSLPVQYLRDVPSGYVPIIAFALSIIPLGIWRLYIYPIFFDPLRHLPEPKGGIPFIRHGVEHIKKPPSEKIHNWIETIPNEGFIRVPSLCGNFRYLPTTAKTLSEVLVKNCYDFEKPEESRTVMRPLLGDGLVVSEGDVHKFQRKNINPMFSFRHIKDLYPLMWEKSVELTESIKSEIVNSANPEKESVIEMSLWAERAALDIIGVAALGRNLNSLRHSDDQLVQLYEWLFTTDGSRFMWMIVVSVLPPWLVEMLPWKTHRKVKNVAAELRRLCAQLIVQRRTAMASETVESPDILAHLIRCNNFSDDELIDQLLTFLAAGHETTSSTFVWLLLVLAQNPEYQKQLRSELVQNIGVAALHEPNAELASSLESLPFLNAICNETTRLYPAVPVTRRIAVRETIISGLRIPAGTDVVVPIWQLNRATHMWGPDAASFSPERWIDQDTGKPNNHGGAESNFSLLTFLHGARSCIGQNFAKAELRTMVAAWVLNFEFEMAKPGEKLTPVGIITVKPKEGLHLKIKPISYI